MSGGTAAFSARRPAPSCSDMEFLGREEGQSRIGGIRPSYQHDHHSRNDGHVPFSAAIPRQRLRRKVRCSMKKIRIPLMFALLTSALLVLLALSLGIGSVPISPGEILRILTGSAADAKASSIILKIRMPRVFGAAILGGALGLSGFLLQTFFRNPVAGPYVLGISSGARLLVCITMIFLLRLFSAAPFICLMAAAFAGSLLVTGLVLLFARRIRSMSTLLVVGIMVGSICTSATDFLITFADEADVVNLHSWSLGSFSAINFASLTPAVLIIIPAAIGAFLLSKPVGAYQLGENYARSMGVNIRTFRLLLITLSSLLSASVTALAGPVSFVGVAVPHIARLLFGTSRPLVIIPASFLFGSVFCLLCDLIARTAFAPSELAISSVTAVFGAPIVIGLMIGRQRRREND